MIALFILGMLGSLPPKQPACSPADRPVSISWSDSAIIHSPDCKWIISVKTNASRQDDAADLILIRKATRESQTVTKVNRDAIIHWSPDGNGFALEDMDFSDHYRFLLFAPFQRSNLKSQGMIVDQLMRQKIKASLESSDKINYYLPRFVAWNKKELVVSVGVITYRGTSGPFTAHCSGFKLTVDPLKITAALTAEQLRSEYKADCQTSP